MFGQSELPSEASSKSVVSCKPLTKAQLEAWRPSYEESRSPSVKSDFVWDYVITSFDSKLEAGSYSTPNLSTSDQNGSADDSSRNQYESRLDTRFGFG